MFAVPAGARRRRHSVRVSCHQRRPTHGRATALLPPPTTIAQHRPVKWQIKSPPARGARTKGENVRRAAAVRRRSDQQRSRWSRQIRQCDRIAQLNGSDAAGRAGIGDWAGTRPARSDAIPATPEAGAEVMYGGGTVTQPTGDGSGRSGRSAGRSGALSDALRRLSDQYSEWAGAFISRRRAVISVSGGSICRHRRPPR